MSTSVHPLSLSAWGGGRGVWASDQIFKNGVGIDSISVFKGGLLGKIGVTFFRGGGGGLQLLSKRKTEIFNDKKSL